MDSENLESLWSSPANQGNTGESERRARLLAGQLERRFRRLVALLVTAGAVLLAFTALLILRLLASPGEGDWALAPLLAPGWLAFGLVVARLRAHRAAHPAAGDSIAALVRAADDEVRLARARLRLLTGLHLASLPAVGLGLWHLVATGRVRPHELTSLGSVLALLVVGSITGILLYDRMELRPRQRQLEDLVASYR